MVLQSNQICVNSKEDLFISLIAFLPAWDCSLFSRTGSHINTTYSGSKIFLSFTACSKYFRKHKVGFFLLSSLKKRQKMIKPLVFPTANVPFYSLLGIRQNGSIRWSYGAAFCLWGDNSRQRGTNSLGMARVFIWKTYLYKAIRKHHQFIIYIISWL